MSERNLGDIDLREYLRLVRRQHPWRRRLRIMGAVLVCTVCIAAGRFAPWFGKGTAHLSLQEAVRVLDQGPVTDWSQQLGVVAVHRHLERSLQILGTVAEQPDQAGRDASLSLGHLAHQALAGIQRLAALPSHADVHEGSLRRVRELLRE